MDLLERQGYQLLSAVCAEAELTALVLEAERLAKVHGQSAHGIRGLLAKSAILQGWATGPDALRLLPEGYRPVRAILFDKLPGSNWKVAWHQDLTICVKSRAELPGYGPWSVKDGVVHVQPPVQLLEQMVTLRLHLDHTGAENGALRVLPGSHQYGRLTPDAIQKLRASTPEHICEAAAGDALLMRPLILHASAPATAPQHRRVVHIEYAPESALAPPLAWAEGSEPTPAAHWSTTR